MIFKSEIIGCRDKVSKVGERSQVFTKAYATGGGMSLLMRKKKMIKAEPNTLLGQNNIKEQMSRTGNDHQQLFVL